MNEYYEEYEDEKKSDSLPIGSSRVGEEQEKGERMNVLVVVGGSGVEGPSDWRRGRRKNRGIESQLFLPLPLFPESVLLFSPACSFSCLGSFVCPDLICSLDYITAKAFPMMGKACTRSQTGALFLPSFQNQAIRQTEASFLPTVL